MEAVQELAQQSGVEEFKTSVGDMAPATLEDSLCHTANGVADPSVNSLSADAAYYASGPDEVMPPEAQPVGETATANEVNSHVEFAETSIQPETLAAHPEEEMLVMETTAAVEHLLNEAKSSEVVETPAEEVVGSAMEVCNDNELLPEESVEKDNIEGPNETVDLKTEVVVENNGNNVECEKSIDADKHNDNGTNILSESSHGIELSEALRSSDVTDNVENNNCSEKGEMFNKEELLDILEGNATSGNEDTDLDIKTLEAQIAIRQLNRLKVKQERKTRDRSYVPRRSRFPRRRDGEKIETNENKDGQKESDDSKSVDKDSENITDENAGQEENKSNESIVNSLVKDWDDDEGVENERSGDTGTENSINDNTNEVPNLQEEVAKEETVTTTPADKSATKTPTDANKSGDEQQTRRLGRVIKKKVIFDPDNPDTFTKVKAVSKVKETPTEKEPPPKKIKPEQTPLRSQSKSPVGKWKKPTPKQNSKHYKRLTEVDKLLMDEGAVNMIYQLTPEATKGKKNMKTKAEFIKKLQSSTPEGKEMKFRERKKESKSEEIEAKKILGSKQRSSLSSSVKSMSVCEDFETHSADDSIIYRRHSSSSYSSSCMSPRRMSDGDANATQNAARVSQQHAEAGTDAQNQTQDGSGDQSTDIFMADTSGEIINKDDCLSIKEKLNSKLSQVLNKRKRESSKTEKPTKQKKVAKTQENAKVVKPDNAIKNISITVDERLAEICIRGASCPMETFKEMEQALNYIDSRKDIFVTLITSESGNLCSKLELQSLLDDNLPRRTNNAYEIAESIRVMLSSLRRHSKLVVSGVWGLCNGLTPALLALSDLSLADHQATFGLDTLPPAPGVGIIPSCRHISQSVMNDLVLFGRNLSAVEAQQAGLIDRTLWPGSAQHLRAAAKDLASQPPQSLLMKKKLLDLKKSDESETTFLSKLEKERDLLVEYWTSVEGQEVIRASTADA